MNQKLSEDTHTINCLDKGYVRLVDTMGSDLTVANAARVSHNKESFELNEKDERLIKFLAEHGHTSPFRHATMQFEVYAPLMIARQWWKYVAGSDHTMEAWNESSRRYVDEEPMFYVPRAGEWRSSPENKKQGSGEVVPIEIGRKATEMLLFISKTSEEMYNEVMARGICAEQARLFLPAYGMYVRWYWTGSLQSVAHLINQRTASDAQVEFQVYAQAIKELATKDFPVSIDVLTHG